MKKYDILYILNYFLILRLIFDMGCLKIDNVPFKFSLDNHTNIKNQTIFSNKIIKNASNTEGMNIIKKVYSNDGENENLYSAENPITGLDFWKSKIIKDGDYADWNIELTNQTLIKNIILEFDFPPTNIIVFSRTEKTNWEPFIHIDYSSEFKDFKPQKNKLNYLIKTLTIENKAIYPMKHLKFRFINHYREGFNILLSKFKLIEDKSQSSFIIRKLVIENGKFRHLCMKFNNNNETRGLVLENCYYCILFNLDLCSFNFKTTDNIGHIFYFSKTGINPFEFYLRNIYDVNETSESKRLSYLNSIKSYSNDILDYSSELDNVNVTSTLSEEYGVRNILYDNLDYWSSELFTKPNCKNVVLEMQLKSEIIVKRIVIEWIKPPALFKIEFCDKNNKCFTQSFLHHVLQFRSYLGDLYHKLKILRLILIPDKDYLSRVCIFSIKRVSLFKNEILLDPRVSREIYGDEASPETLYSDNFIFTRIDNAKLGLELQEKLTQNIQISDSIPEKIINTFNYLKHIYNDNSRKSLKAIINDAETLYRDYSYKSDKSVKFIKNLFNSLESKNVDSFSNHMNDNTTHIKNIITKYLEILNDVKDAAEKKFALNVIERQNENQNALNVSYLEKIVNMNNYLIDQESAFFEETYSDKYRYKLSLKLKFLEYLDQVFKKVDFYSSLKSTFKNYEKILLDLEKYNANWIEHMHTLIENTYNKLINNKKKELNSLMKKIEISLQNIKLIRRLDTYLYLPFYNRAINPETLSESGLECKLITLIKNSYYDNFFVKFLVNYNNTNFDSENIVMFKFLSRRFYYYLKITFDKIELRNRELENDNLITAHNLLTKTDKYNSVDGFSKLLFIMIRVYKGNLKITIKIDYNPIPKEILQYLEEIEKIDYDKLISMYQEDYNKFQNYYKNSEEIYSGDDINLFLNGYMGFYSSAENLNILLSARIPTELLKSKKFFISALNTKYKYYYFPDSDKLTPISLDKEIKTLLSLDNTWGYYDTNFKVINDFYFKFEIDLGKIFNNNIYFKLESERSDYHIINHIIRLNNSFLIKIFYVSKKSKSITKIYRTNMSYDKYTENIVFIYEKNLNTVRLKIKSRKNSITRLFTITDFSFISFGFLLNYSNRLALKSIYFTDTNNLERKDELNEKIIFNKCSKINYNIYKLNCVSKDKVYCENVFCKICCKRTASIEPNTAKCLEKCYKILRKDIV